MYRRSQQRSRHDALSELQHTATHCKPLQRIHMRMIVYTFTLIGEASRARGIVRLEHCNTLHHPSTHCNTLPHTAWYEGCLYTYSYLQEKLAELEAWRAQHFAGQHDSREIQNLLSAAQKAADRHAADAQVMCSCVVYMYMNVYMYIFTYIYIHVYIYIYIRIYVYIYTYVYWCMDIYMDTYVYLYVHNCWYRYIHTYVCMFVCICTYIHS